MAGMQVQEVRHMVKRMNKLEETLKVVSAHLEEVQPNRELENQFALARSKHSAKIMARATQTDFYFETAGPEDCYDEISERYIPPNC